MIPTWEPDVALLQATIRSVLAEELTQAQIEIVDDGSRRFDPSSFVGALGDGRVRSSRHDNRGIGGAWNECLLRARGEWIHVLHQDDVVRPGFYAAARAAIESVPDARAVVGQTEFLDERERVRRRSFSAELPAGILEDWIEHVFADLKLQCASVVVRRDAYEALGGFDETLRYVLDWDLWKRLASRFPIVYAPDAVAGYRVHRGSETTRLTRTGRNMEEIRASIERDRAILPASIADDVIRRTKTNYAHFAVDNAGKILRGSGDLPAAVRQLRAARELTSWREVASYVGGRLLGRRDRGAFSRRTS
jgi:GT2 family glycosyltransferase